MTGVAGEVGKDVATRDVLLLIQLPSKDPELLPSQTFESEYMKFEDEPVKFVFELNPDKVGLQL